jgi:hypothetical protein
MSAKSGPSNRRILAEVAAFLLLVPMIGMFRATSDAWEWLLLGSVWVAVPIVLQVALPWKHKPSYGLFVLSALAGFVFIATLIEAISKIKGVEPDTTSEHFVFAVVLALYVVYVFAIAEELFFPRIVVFGWRQHPNIMLEIGLTVFLVAALYGLSNLAESWPERSQVISLYVAMVVASAILWFPMGRWSPRFAPLVMLLSADLLLRSGQDVSVLLSPATWLSGWVIGELAREAVGEESWLLTRWRRRKGLMPSGSPEKLSTPLSAN